MLDRLTPNPGSRRPRRRVGRGAGSGLGKTSGRGQKGAGARAGTKKRAWFEGGQMPLARRLPKRGFNNLFRAPAQIVNVGALGGFEANAVVDAAALASAGLVRSAAAPVKLLAEGELCVPIVARVAAVSAAAARKIEAAGGRVELEGASSDGGASA
jgi:large subunit ribosomal protein L15